MPVVDHKEPVSMKILVTGGSGFIGTNFIRNLLSRQDFQGSVLNLDLLTYAGHPANLADLPQRFGPERYRFLQGDIADASLVLKLFQEEQPQVVIHFAAESHVDRSIFGPAAFVQTNVVGTFTLLEAARNVWKDRRDVRFHHVSTDEVYGSLGDEGAFLETTPYNPRSPYSATKAASDHLVRAYGNTYGLPYTITNCSNNYGPYQFPEKLIPLMILNMMEGKPLPVYGKGLNVRDWLHVSDHTEAILRVAREGTPGETYNVGGGAEWRNIDIVHHLCDSVAQETGRNPDALKGLITFVKDRPGHDHRYAIDATKIRTELGWTPRVSFAQGLSETVRWYLSHMDWVDSIRTGEYRKWIERNYGER